MLGPAAAWIGSGVFVASTAYLRRATEFLNDLAAAALLLAAAAYYVRYESAAGLVIIALVAGAVWFKELSGSSRQIAGTGAATIVLLIPHFLFSTAKTGSVLGVFEAARTTASGEGGLRDYLSRLPGRLAGSIGAVVMFAGAVYSVALVVRAIQERRWPPATRTAVFLSSTAVVIIVTHSNLRHTRCDRLRSGRPHRRRVDLRSRARSVVQIRRHLVERPPRGTLAFLPSR